MQLDLGYAVALIVSAVLLVAVCVGWVLDRRAPAGRGLSVGASFAAAFGAGVTQTSGLALLSALVDAGSASRMLYQPIVSQYFGLSVAAVTAMLLAQIAGMVARRAAVRAPALWFSVCAVLSVVSLASIWVAQHVLLTVQYSGLIVSVYLAPFAMAAVLTALLFARAIAFIVSPPRRAVSDDPQPAPAPEPMRPRLPVVPTLLRPTGVLREPDSRHDRPRIASSVNRD